MGECFRECSCLLVGLKLVLCGFNCRAFTMGLEVSDLLNM